MDATNVEREIYDFVVENFLYGKANGLGRDESLLGKGVIDSTGVLELLAFLQERFAIRVEDDEVIPGNLDSIKNMVTYLGNKLGGKS